MPDHASKLRELAEKIRMGVFLDADECNTVPALLESLVPVAEAIERDFQNAVRHGKKWLDSDIDMKGAEAFLNALENLK